MDAAARIFIDFSVRKLELLTSRIESCLDQLNEEQVWTRGGENENAAGNLVLHLCGNVRQWIVSGVGGAPDMRERDAEFAAQGGVSISDLKRRLRDVADESAAVLRQIPAARLTDRVTIQDYDVAVMEAIYHVIEHFSMHTAQIMFLTKMLTGDDLGFYHHLRRAAAHGQKTP
ncbi:MAG: DUF1572 family protein [Bryobacteraceae bacterium]|jgi:uncharacterized damage-inducible protein DinB